MSTTFWLTDEDADIAGYKRAKLGYRSDICSLVRAVTNSSAGPSTGIPITRTAGGTVLTWITDPLDGTDLTAAAWQFHIWALESDALANLALRFEVYAFTNAEAGVALLDDNNGVELGTVTKDYARTTGNATPTVMADGDRLVFKILLDDAVSMAAGYTATVSYNGERGYSEGDSYIVCPDNIAITADVPASTMTAVRNLLQDNSSTNPLLTDTQMKQAINEAIREYSQSFPFDVVTSLNGDGSTTDFPLPNQWVWGVSNFTEVEYPAGQRPRQLLDNRAWEVVESSLGGQPVRVLSFPYATPSSGTGNVVMRYTTIHTHTDIYSTLKPSELDAVHLLAASKAALAEAAREAASSDSTINADSVNYRDGETRWRAVSKELRARYDRLIGNSTENQAATFSRNWDVMDSQGRDRLTHSRWFR